MIQGISWYYILKHYNVGYSSISLIINYSLRNNSLTSLLAASSMNTHGWTGPESNGDFLSRPWSNIAFMAGHRHPLTISDTAADTESSPAKQYLLLLKK